MLKQKQRHQLLRAEQRLAVVVALEILGEGQPLQLRVDERAANPDPAQVHGQVIRVLDEVVGDERREVAVALREHVQIVGHHVRVLLVPHAHELGHVVRDRAHVQHAGTLRARGVPRRAAAAREARGRRLIEPDHVRARRPRVLVGARRAARCCFE